MRLPEGIFLDLNATGQGRGAYICRDPGCVKAALERGALARTLRTGVPKQRAEALRQQALEYLVGVETER